MAKKYTQRISAVFSVFERELLEHLVETNGGDISTHLRNALRGYAREVPNFSPTAFAKRIDKLAKATPKLEEREDLQRDLRYFIRDVQSEGPSGVHALTRPGDAVEIDSTELKRS